MISLQRWLREQGLTILQEQAMSGGCIAQTRCITLSNGKKVFVKCMNPSHPRMYSAEAEGLNALASCQKIRVPSVLYYDEYGLVLEYIEQGSKPHDFDRRLGRQLASLHHLPVPSFGFSGNTFCGATEQPNTRTVDGYAFYAEQRFGYLARRCYDQGLIGSNTLAGIESINARLNHLVPKQKPCLLHGDLWSGNVIANKNGEPVLIDPAAYWGWPEADLAMTQLFGGFSDDLYAAYQEVMPLQKGWQARFELYNLWHLLNHLLLFGSSYKSDVMRVVAKFR